MCSYSTKGQASLVIEKLRQRKRLEEEVGGRGWRRRRRHGKR